MKRFGEHVLPVQRTNYNARPKGPYRVKILISANTAWSLANFRAGLIRSLIAAGHEVVAAAPTDAARAMVEAIGCRFVDLPMDNRGTSPARDAALLGRYVGLMRRERPDAFLGFTIKPNIYGGMAARLYGVPSLNNISGLGTAFGRETALTTLVRRLYRHALTAADVVFFQNGDDREAFVAEGIVRAEQARLLPGSGVDLARFAPPDRPPNGRNFLLAGRLLWAKGVGDYVAAARVVRDQYPDAVFRVLGFVADGDPASVSFADIARWEEEGTISYCGETDDVRPFLADADCVVLPSDYAEGTPRTLIEAAAMGRAIVTSDRPGCRDVVLDGLSGFIVPPRDTTQLAATLARFAALPAADMATMGAEGRRLAERYFDEAIVVRAYLEAVETSWHRRQHPNLARRDVLPAR